MKIGLPFEQLLNEVSHVNDIIYNINRGHIPMTPTISKLLSDKESERVTAFHVTDENHIDSIKNMLGKRNTISTFQFFSEEKLGEIGGVCTNGGIILKLSGNFVLSSSNDISSINDKSLNRKWIQSNKLFKGLNYNLTIDNNKLGNVSVNTKEIKLWLKELYNFVKENKKTIQKNLIDFIIYSSNNGNWNETLIRNIQIDGIIWKPTKIFGKPCYDTSSERCKQLINDFILKLKQLTPNVTTTNNPDEILTWFKDNGGHTDISGFKNEHFKTLSDNLMVEYITSGNGLTDEQYETIKNNKNLLKLYIDTTNNKMDDFIKNFDGHKYISFTNSELIVVDNNKLNDYKKIVNLLFDKIINGGYVFDGEITDIDLTFVDKNKFNKLNYNKIYSLFFETTDPQKIMKMLGRKGIEFVNQLTYDSFTSLINNSKSNYKIISILGQKFNEFIDYICKDIQKALQFIKNRDKFISILLTNKNFINIINDKNIFHLMCESNYPDKIINVLGEKGVNFIKKLPVTSDDSKYDVFWLIRNSKNPYKVEELFKKYNKI